MDTGLGLLSDQKSGRCKRAQASASRLTSCTLHLFDAEFSCGHGGRVMSWGIICEQEVTPPENGTNALLRCFSDLKKMEIQRLVFVRW